MKKETEIKKNLTSLCLKTAFLEISVSFIFIVMFSAVMYLFNLNKVLSTIFATVSVSFGALIASFFTAKKLQNKGYLIGGAVGISTFIIITLISFVMDDGGITFNTLFHFIIIMLSSLIGGICGVNKQGKKYI